MAELSEDAYSKIIPAKKAENKLKALKKIWKIIFISCILISAAAGCGGKELQLDPKDAAEQLKAELTFEDTLSELEESRFEVLYSADPEDISDWAVYVSTGATAEEIAVVQATGEAAAERVKEALLGRIEDQRESFEDYVPKELVKLENPVLEVHGKYVFLCICSDPADAEKVIDGLLR